MNKKYNDIFYVFHTTAEFNNFTQEKLTRQEWEGIEVPLPSNELEILSLIKKGWHNPDIIINKIPSFLSKSKITSSPEMHNHIYHHY